MHLGHRARIKKEFLENGLSHFPDHKVLELLLFYSIPRQDTNEIGHNLIKRFGSLSGVFDAPYELLIETEGIGKESAALIKTVSQIMDKYLNDYKKSNIFTLKTYDDIKIYLKNMFIGLSTEILYIVCLANNGKILFSDVLSEGSPETVGIRPVDVIKTALQSNAVSVILAHNHPHGIAMPSRADIMTTNILKKELDRIEIKLFDHVIVANDEMYSMAENMLI